MPCRRLCVKWNAKKPVDGGRYASGQVRCDTCEIFMFPSPEHTHNTRTGAPDGNPENGLSCNCCNSRISTRAKSARYGKYQDPNSQESLEVEEIKYYLGDQIRPQGNFQFVVIKVLFQNQGSASKELLVGKLEFYNRDKPPQDYSNHMVFSILEKNGIIISEDNGYRINITDKFDSSDALDIISICNQKIYKNKPNNKRNYFIALGPWENWGFTFENLPVKWGVADTTPSNIAVYDQLKEGDVVFYYATKDQPTPFSDRGFFGIGLVSEKEIEKDNPYWPEEQRDGKTYFTHRFYLDTLKVVKNNSELIPLNEGLPLVKGLNHITEGKPLYELLENTREKWGSFFTNETMPTLRLSEDIEELIKKFDENRKYFNPDRESEEERMKSREDFISRFPIHKISEMTIDEYVIGKHDPLTGDTNRTTFCYGLEQGIIGFGGIGGTPANKFGIYYNKSEGDYKYNKTFFKSSEEAFDQIKRSINIILGAGRQFQKDGDVGSISNTFEVDFKIKSQVRSKILSVYFPDLFLDIHSKPHLEKILEKLDLHQKALEGKIIERQLLLLEIKNSHPVMSKWSNQDYSHFLWNALIKFPEEHSEQNFLLVKYSPDQKKWDDELGKSYRYEKIGDYTKVNSSSKTIWYYLKGQELYFWGYGDVESVNQEPDNEFIAIMSDFEFFNKPDPNTPISTSTLVPKKAEKSLQEKIMKSPSWTSQNSIVEIDQELYDEIISPDSELEIFEDVPLRRLSSTEMETGIQKIREDFLVDPNIVREIVISIASGRHVILAGPVGTGKTELARKIPRTFWTENGGYYAEEHTANADWNTTDVIGGIMPKMINGEPNYEIQLGCVSETVRKNWQNDEYSNRITDIRNDEPCRGTWLVIDEFNRADIDKAFGQLFTSLESRKLKVPATNKIGYTEMIIPQDYRIICTLNTADKHYLFHLSDALKRRFAYIEMNSPLRTERESEIYYALKNAIGQLPEDDYSSLVILDHAYDKKIIDREKSNKEFTLMVEKAYAVLDFIRFSKPLGTAILKSMYQTMLVASLMRINYDKVLDFGLRTNLIPQLETVSPTTLETIIEVFYGKPIEFFEDVYNNQPNKGKYKDDFTHLLDFMGLSGGHKKQLSDQFTKNQLKPDSWSDLRNKFEPKYTLKEELFKTSLQDLIKSSILI